MVPPPSEPDVEFNPPPNWPVPLGFDPRLGHLADPAWPAAPLGWTFWVRRARPAAGLRYVRRVGPWRLVAGIAVALVAVGFVVRAVDRQSFPTGVGSCWAPGGTAADRYQPVRCGSPEARYTVESEVTDTAQCPESSDSYFDDGDIVQCLRRTS